jgi:hypothetical protein
MIINHHLHVMHNFCISPMSLLGHPGNAGIIAEYTCGLRVKHERHSKKALDPFCVMLAGCSVHIETIGQSRAAKTEQQAHVDAYL